MLNIIPAEHQHVSLLMLAFISKALHCLVYVVGVGGHNWESLTMSSAWTAPGFWLAAWGQQLFEEQTFATTSSLQSSSPPLLVQFYWQHNVV